MYQPTPKAAWAGRASGKQQYLHEKVLLHDISSRKMPDTERPIVLLGYAEDEGVRRNKGRVGAKEGPLAIRQALAKMANHLPEKQTLLDCGDIVCQDTDMEGAQQEVAEAVDFLLEQGARPILLGGGHDLSYAHFKGLWQFLQKQQSNSIGIINLDAHFDLREDEGGQGHSGSPFRQISELVGEYNFEYLCLGIQRSANIPDLFATAERLGVQYLDNTDFHISRWNLVEARLLHFIGQVDHIYLTIDLDGFHAGIAPGVSAPSPQGFDWEVARRTMGLIAQSGKLLSMDVVELNPQYDQNGVTAKLAAASVLEGVAFGFAQATSSLRRPLRSGDRFA